MGKNRTRVREKHTKWNLRKNLVTTIKEGGRTYHLGILDPPEAARRKAANARAEWDRVNMATVSTRVRGPQARAYAEYCRALGRTPYADLRAYVLQCIGAKSR